ncbi:electron transfer flavoprotein subunit beta/FixA family protein [Haloarcula salinisoli]|uniref:Electron transfer flavoprotein subunit beta/FixA family protein n=1 Tax=Haloarcula salinisoli TaxID=2487746 RepID=A0A8J8CBN9_9EURY|nr:electron transfer flavoprotein subunit beta/FixA family protein [Halomicroarcula salinisoli]MBX0287689.1 electron transfer flavoprotein subunit beta/FixA family protein [Halomicroarcula salinisoli]MBX0304618.1 electron transfer flavoprotein subunit beta/FixA family protein [Halomicroarcula salinisoli]
MQILVTVAPVSRADGDSDTEYRLGAWDAHALEAAVRLRETHGDVTIVTATVGPPAADPVVRAALAKGGDRGIRVWDDSLAAAALFDPRLKARLLAEVVDDVDPDIVLAGARSGPDGFGATGVTLASSLSYGWATVVTDIALDRDAGVVSVRSDRDGPHVDLVDVDLPAVLTVGTGCNEPRPASLGAVRATHRADLAVRSLDDLGLEPSDIERSLTRVGTADRDRGVTLFEGPPEEAVADLAQVLRAHGVEP